MLGYAREEYVGQRIADFHADPGAIADILARLGRGERLREYPARLRCKDDTLKSVLIDSSAIWDEGRFVHTHCFTRDVTEWEEAEEARALLAAIVEATDDAVISKTLDGVVTSWNAGAEHIFGYAATEMIGRPIEVIIPVERHEEEQDRLRRGESIDHFATVRLTKDGRLVDVSLRGPADFELQRPVDIIERQVTQMSRLIDDLLNRSRISRGTLELRREHVTSAAIVEAAIEACRDDVQSKAHRLRLHMPAKPVELYADRERLVQVLCNLIGNAAKYTPPGPAERQGPDARRQLRRPPGEAGAARRPRAAARRGPCTAEPLTSSIYCNTVPRMKTTFDIPEELLVEAKKRAAELRRPLRALVTEGLRAQLATGGVRSGPATKRQTRPRIRWVTVKGALAPGLDVANREHMHEWLRRTP